MHNNSLEYLCLEDQTCLGIIQNLGKILKFVVPHMTVVKFSLFSVSAIYKVRSSCVHTSMKMTLVQMLVKRCYLSIIKKTRRSFNLDATNKLTSRLFPPLGPPWESKSFFPLVNITVVWYFNHLDLLYQDTSIAEGLDAPYFLRAFEVNLYNTDGIWTCIS